MLTSGSPPPPIKDDSWGSPGVLWSDSIISLLTLRFSEFLIFLGLLINIFSRRDTSLLITVVVALFLIVYCLLGGRTLESSLGGANFEISSVEASIPRRLGFLFFQLKTILVELGSTTDLMG
jgi:apolipoprotein N-acyltransferase